MRIRSLVPVLVVLLTPTLTYADDHFADLFAGASRMRASSLWGFHETYAITTPEHAPLSWVLGDLGVHVGSHRGQGEGRGQGRSDNDATQVSILGGVRYSLPRVAGRYMPFAQALIGAISLSGQGGRRETNFAGTVGGGWDIAVGKERIEGGPEAHDHISTKWAVRVQADYIFDGEDGNAYRVSGGIVYRFKK